MACKTSSRFVSLRPLGFKFNPLVFNWVAPPYRVYDS